MHKWQNITSYTAVLIALGFGACSPKADTPEANAAPEQTAPTKSMASYAEPLAEEETGNSNVLPFPYDGNWAIIHDANFHSMIDGRFILMDSGATSKAFKGTMHGGTVGGVAVSRKPVKFISLQHIIHAEFLASEQILLRSMTLRA